MLKRVFLGLAALFLLSLGPAAHAANSQNVGVCDPKFPANCVKPNADGSINISGSITVTLSNYALETGGNLAAARADLDALVTASSAPAGILGVNGSTIATNANPFPVRVGDATNQITVKAASTGSVTTDTALVVSQSPNVSAPCGPPIAISQTSSTDVHTFTNTGYICSIVLVTDTAQKLSLLEGTGSVCASNQSVLAGSGTAANGMSFAANGGFSSVNDRVIIKFNGSAHHLCVTQSGSGLVAGFITVADQ
jgi:hypothetical protein